MLTPNEVLLKSIFGPDDPEAEGVALKRKKEWRNKFIEEAMSLYEKVKDDTWIKQRGQLYPVIHRLGGFVLIVKKDNTVERVMIMSNEPAVTPVPADEFDDYEIIQVKD